MVSRHSANLRESAEFPTSVKEVVAMFVWLLDTGESYRPHP
jgi:hypothetical protein